MSVELSTERQIKKAMAKGAFDNLPGRCKPLDLNGYFETPEHLRICYSMLKNGDFVPEEVQKLKNIEVLKEQLAACSDETQKQQLAKIISEKTLSVTLAMERYKRDK